MNPLAERALLLRSRWPLYLLMLLFWVMILPVQAATLNMAKPGSGTGLIESAPDGISCGADCTGSYDTDTAVTLTATPGVASSFVGWAAGVCAGQNSVCALNMTATDQTVAAYFAGARVVAGDMYTLALTRDGMVWAWGDNEYGQLGDGSTTNRATPVQVSGLTGVIALATGYSHSLALKSDGTVWAWGYNGSGQLGNDDYYRSSTPVQTKGAGGAGFLYLTVDQLTVSKAGTGSGTVTSSPAGISCGSDCSESYTSGASITLTASAASGSTFAGWSGACSGTASTCTVSMSAAKTVTATFNPSSPSSNRILAGLSSTGQVYYSSTLTRWTNVPGTTLNQLIIGDFNSDGLDDLAGINSTGKIYYSTNRSSWTNIPGTLSQLLAADFDGDGKKDDLAGINSTGQIYYSTNRSSWTNIPGLLNRLARY